MKIFRTVLFLCTAAFFLQAGEDSLFGIKFGYLGPGTVKVAGTAFGTDASSVYGAFFDYRVAERLYMNFYIDRQNIAAFDYSEPLLDFGGGFKAVMHLKESAVMLRPGIAFGYGMIPEIDLGGYTAESTSYFIIKPSLEVVVPFGSENAVVGEVGFISAPAGGNVDYSVTLDPTLIMRLGIIF